MRWGKPNTERKRGRFMFALLPTRLKDGTWLWWEPVWRYEHSGEAAGLFDYYADPEPLWLRLAAGVNDTIEDTEGKE